MGCRRGPKNQIMVGGDVLRLLCRNVCQKISAHVDGGLSGGTRVHRPGSEDPHRREWNSNCSVDKKIQELESEIRKLCAKETETSTGLLSQAKPPNKPKIVPVQIV